MQLKKPLILLYISFTSTVLLISSPAKATNWIEKVAIHGFMNSTYSRTDERAFFNGEFENNVHEEGSGINKEGSFHNTKFGLNISTSLLEDVNFSAQLFSSLEHDDYNISLDWAFTAIQISEEFVFRAGKIKYPVGLVNEYIDVGIAYPWIQAPVVLYTEESNGPLATRESYSGISLVWEKSFDSWTVDIDAFGGQVDLESMTIKQMAGVKLQASWNDAITLQASNYSGTMLPDDPMSMMGMMMNEQKHGASVYGVKIDWTNIVAWHEKAKVNMDMLMMGVKTDIADSNSSYHTLGYRLGKWLPIYTHQNWDQNSGKGHKIKTLGLNYTMNPSVVFKIEAGDIETDGVGLFDVAPSKETVNLYRASLNMVF